MLIELEKDSTQTTKSVPSVSQHAGIFCALLVALAVFATYPVLEAGTIDDWSYARTALDSLHSGHIVYNGWANPMLGWQVAWGAFIIKLFGFSFLALRLSTLPFAMATAYLLYEIGVRLGLTVRNALLLTLTVVLSPLYVPVAATYMTDVPAFFWLIAGVYACVRATSAKTSRSCILWVTLGTAAGVVGGTGRQIVWLVALVMVPSAALLRRKQRGVLVAAALLWVGSVIAIAVCLHWFYQQPHSVVEKLIGDLPPKPIEHVLQQLRDIALSPLLLTLPVLSAFLVLIKRGSKKVLFVSLGVGVLFFAARMHSHGAGAFAPWMSDMVTEFGVAGSGQWEGLGLKPVVIQPWVRALITCIILLSTCAWLSVLLPRLLSRPRLQEARKEPGPSWLALTLLVGPFVTAYFVLMMPRAVFGITWDRYLLPLVAIFAIGLLRFFQESSSSVQAPAICFVLLVLFSVYGVAATHDYFCTQRARLVAASSITATGIPRTQVQGGFEYDGWTQLLAEDYLRPADGAADHLKGFPVSCQFEFLKQTPAIDPHYFVEFSPQECFAASRFPAIEYDTWLPPFHRNIYIGQLR